MIFDCFSFFNELDILDIRLNVLAPVVDKFVLVEAVRRHSGEPKELYFEKNKQRFAPFLDKIIHVVVDDEPELPPDCPKLIAAWAYENHQRNAIVRGLKGVRDDDVVIISDLDEIPNPAQVRKYTQKCVEEGVVAVFSQMSCRYYLNFISMTMPQWRVSKILSWKTFCDDATYAKMEQHIPMPEFANKGPTPTRVRFLRPQLVIFDGGWHFSYYGGAKQIQLKMKSIADYVCDKAADMSLEEIERCVKAGEDPLGRGERFYAVPLDARFPDYIRENRERYASGILPCERVAFRTRLLCVCMRVKAWMVRVLSRCVPSWAKPAVYAVYRRVVKHPIPLMKDQLSQKLEKGS